MISNEENGLLVPLKFLRNYPIQFLKLASEPRLKHEYCKNALETVKQFDKVLMVDKSLDLYKTL